MGIKILKYSKYFEKSKNFKNAKIIVEYKCVCKCEIKNYVITIQNKSLPNSLHSSRAWSCLFNVYDFLNP